MSAPATPANDRLLRALRREPVDRTPVWLMRQAGRYLPEYRETRARAGSFMTLCRTPELGCEVAMQPLRRYPLDAAILFSDILTIPDAMGLGLHFAEGEGPRFHHPVRDRAGVERLGVPDPEVELRYVMDTVRTIARELDGSIPLIGFSGSPWTLATYMVEGAGSRDFARAKGLVYGEPEVAHRLLSTVADAVALYARAQVDAGAQVMMLFDTWGGVLTPGAYREFSLAYMARVIEALGDSVPVVLFTKGGGAWVEAQAGSGCAGVGLDWTTELGDARARVGERVALQGNLDPCVLYASPERIRAAVDAALASYGDGPGHVFNLGHGLQPGMDPDRVGACVAAVHELSPRHHR